MEHPKAVGDRSTLAAMLVLQAAGYAISVPFGENTRYDLVIDDHERLVRAQCKTGRLRDGGIRFATCSTYGHHRNPRTARKSYSGQIDYFAVYCPENGGVYLVPIADLAVRIQATLRLTPALNSQKRGVRPAARYFIGRVEFDAIAAKTEPGASAGA